MWTKGEAYHVPPITSPQRHRPLVIRLWQILSHPLKALYNILIRIPTPILANTVRKRLSIPRATRHVRCDHNIPLLREDGWVPPCGPAVRPTPLRAAVDEVGDRVLPAWLEGTGLEDPRMDFFVDVWVRGWSPDTGDLLLAEAKLAAGGGI